jgi:hypothetical protein
MGPILREDWSVAVRDRKPGLAVVNGALALLLNVMPAAHRGDFAGTLEAAAKDDGGNNSGRGDGGGRGSGGGPGSSGSGSGGVDDRTPGADDGRQSGHFEVTYPDGFTENIRNGIFELKDPLGRRVIKRSATQKDYDRLSAHGT